MRELTIADLVAIGKAAGLPDEASAEFYQGPKAPGKAHKVNKRKFTEKERIDITKLWAEESRATDHQGANHKLASEYGCSAMQINGLILQLRRKGWLVKAKSGGHKLSKLGLQERDNFQRRSSGQRRKA
jgi:biotin operon repressor